MVSLHLDTSSQHPPAAGDNASGVASIVALAEYYAKVPQADRRRTMIFVGLDGHHNSGAGAGVGRRWMWDNRARLFSKNAADRLPCLPPLVAAFSSRVSNTFSRRTPVFTYTWCST